jgi:hypothetical protein
MTDVLLALRARRGDREDRALTMSRDGIDISGTSFRWAEIDRITYRAEDRYLGDAYLGTTCTLEVGNACRKRRHFRLDSGVTYPLRTRDDERRERNRAAWARAVKILDERVGTRLVSEAVTAVGRHKEATFAGLRFDSTGVHRRGIFGRSLPWHAIIDTEMRRQRLRVLACERGWATAIERPVGAWNVVLLPRMIGALVTEVSCGCGRC